MLDRWSLEVISKPLAHGARLLANSNISANQISIGGFFVGILVLPFLFLQLYSVALLLIIINRIMDGLDGHLARIHGPTIRGAYLDITLDFIFYATVPLGFALAVPEKNSLAATVLIFSFVASGSSFLAFAIMAEKKKMTNVTYPSKGIYYLAGLAEGTETIIFFCLFCLFPEKFPTLAYIFSFICMLSATIRITGSCKNLDE